jgi:hypothetical protein
MSKRRRRPRFRRCSAAATDVRQRSGCRGPNRGRGCPETREALDRLRESLQDRCAENRTLRTVSNISGVSSPRAKIFRFRFSEAYDFIRASRTHQRGVRVVTNVGRGMRWTRWYRETSGTNATAKSCGPGPPTLGSSSQSQLRATVAIKPGTPRRARDKS